jgi:outer membrane protein assembly factor BamB
VIDVTIIEVVTLLRIILPIIFASLALPPLPLQSLPSTVRWTITLPARAVAPPVIAGDLVVVGLQSGDVIAYGAKDGKEVWRVPLRPDQPMVADQTLLFVAAGEVMHAMDAADGKALWEAPTGTITAPFLVHGGWVIAASEGQLAAFREIDGAKVWSQPGSPLHTGPSIEGDNLYVPLDEGRLLALDVRTGEERWSRFPAKGPLSEVLAFPDRVWVGAANKELFVYRASDGEIEWKYPIGAELRGPPVSDNTHVIVTGRDNMVRAFSRKNGKLEWHAALPYRPVGPMLAGRFVVVPGTAAEIQAFEIATGKLAGQIKLEQPLPVAPAFAGSGASALIAAVTGTITGEWRLVVAAPQAPQAPPE